MPYRTYSGGLAGSFGVSPLNSELYGLGEYFRSGSTLSPSKWAAQQKQQTAAGGVPGTVNAKGEVSQVAAPGAANFPGTLAGTPVREYSPAYGGIPTVPSPASSQTQAIASNLASLPNLIDLAGQINQFNLAQQRKQYEASFPNYSQAEAQVSQNVLSGLQGQLSPGTMRNMSQAAAERAVTRGMPSQTGGPTVGNLDYLRLLGLTTEDQQAKALGQLSAFNATSPRTPLYNPAAFSITPEQQYNAALQASVWNAAPNPAAAAAAAMEAARAGANFGYKGANAPGYSGGFQAPSTAANLNKIVQRYGQTAGLAPQNQGQGTGSLSYMPSYVGYSQPYLSATAPSSTPSVSYSNPAYAPSFDYSAMPGVVNPSIADFDYSSIPSSLYPSYAPGNPINENVTPGEFNTLGTYPFEEYDYLSGYSW